MDKVFKKDQVKFVEGRPCRFKFFKSCFPRILLGPFLNTLSHTVEKYILVACEILSSSMISDLYKYWFVKLLKMTSER